VLGGQAAVALPRQGLEIRGVKFQIGTLGPRYPVMDFLGGPAASLVALADWMLLQKQQP
jgi:hypothetical protein